MKTGAFQWSARYQKVLDPREVNENFRKGAQYIKDCLALRYTYTMMRINLTGMDLSGSTAFRNTIIPFWPYGDSSMEIVGGELITSNFAAGEKLHVTWNGGSSIPVSTSGVGPPANTNTILPNGGPTEDWRYIEVEAVAGKVLNSNTQQRSVRVGDIAPIGIYCLEVGSDTGVNIDPNLGMTAELVLWMKSSRGTNPEFTLPELFNGEDAADADKFNSICSDLETQRANATSPTNQDTWRLDCFTVRDVPLVGGNALASVEAACCGASIPAPNNNLPVQGAFRLARLDYYISTDAAQFSAAGDGRTFAAFVSPALATVGQQLDQPASTYNHIFRVGDVLASPEISTPASDSMTPATDSEFGIGDFNPATNPVLGGRIKTLIVYLWYRLTT